MKFPWKRKRREAPDAGDFVSVTFSDVDALAAYIVSDLARRFPNVACDCPGGVHVPGMAHTHP